MLELRHTYSHLCLFRLFRSFHLFFHLFFAFPLVPNDVSERHTSRRLYQGFQYEFNDTVTLAPCFRARRLPLKANTLWHDQCGLPVRELVVLLVPGLHTRRLRYTESVFPARVHRFPGRCP